jgi:DNA-binding MarR family transcriptional regulator
MATTLANPQTPAASDLDLGEDAALLVDLLKLGTFIARPMREGVAEPMGLSPNDLKIILALGGEGELAGHELSDIMGLPPMNVSRAIAALRERGLVEPGQDASNRRRKPVRLTAAGSALFRQTIPAMAAVGGHLFADFTPKERAVFHAAAQAILARMTAG